MNTLRNFYILLLSLLTTFLCSNAATPDQQALLEALMDESLRSHRVQACDGERVTLSCPRNTHIMVETGFYGRVVPENQLCPGRAPSNRRGSYSGTCDVIQAQTRLSELCDKKRKCTIYVDTTTFEDDPCPSTSKYLQMSYKCKPISFDGESFCGGTEMQLSCRDGKRLAIYSATFGRTIRGQAAHCPAPPKHFKRDCTLDVLPTVLSQCHAKSSCSMSVSESTLNKPCPSEAQPYLNILFMCVNEEIFSEEAINGELPSLELYKKQFASGSNKNSLNSDEEDEWEKLSERMDAVEKQVLPKPEPSVSDVQRVESAKHQVNNDGTYITEDRYSMRSSDGISGMEGESQAERVEGNAVGIAHDLITMVTFFKENKEKVLVCIVLMVALALCLLLIACIVMKCVGGKKQDPRVRYSIERSQLLSKSSPYSVLGGGPSSLTDIGDLDSETFLRFSLTTPPRSSHYDF